MSKFPNQTNFQFFDKQTNKYISEKNKTEGVGVMIQSKIEISNLLLICMLMLLIGLTKNANANSNPKEWENPEIISINTEQPHNTLMPYQNFEQALKAERFASPFFKSLNGKWKINWVEKPTDRPLDFY